MKIDFFLNDEKIEVEAEVEESLFSILRKSGIKSVKNGCQKGTCASCVVLLDGKPVPSCSVKLCAVQGAKVTTLEGFAGTSDYADIAGGFRKAKIRPCQFCSAARILCVHELLERNWRPSKEECEEFADSIHCACTEKGAFMDAIIYATALRHARLGKRRS